MIAFEIPSGALADSWGRKNMLHLSNFLAVLGFSVWLIFDKNFLVLAIGHSIWALSYSCGTGTKEALLYDNLKAMNKENLYDKITSFEKFIFYGAIGIASLIGTIWQK